MKTILTIFCLVASISVGFSQGTVNFSTISSTYSVTTNISGNPLGPFGKIDKGVDDYYFALLIQPYTGAAASTISQNPLVGWTFTGAYANNSTLVAGGIKGNNALTVSGWAPGTPEYVEVVGWSASLGTTWSDISAQLTGGSWSAFGYYGNSVVGVVYSGGAGTPAAPPAPIFSPTGVSSGWALSPNPDIPPPPPPVPEPATFALIGLGGLGMAVLRHRRRWLFSRYGSRAP